MPIMNWQQGDLIEITKHHVEASGLSGYEYSQWLLAIEPPTDNDQPSWLVVRDDDEFVKIGTYVDTDYVEQHRVKLLYSHANRAVEADPHAIEPEVTPRGALLREAEALITGDRNKSYGSPTENFQNIADLWTVQFGHKLADGQGFTAPDVAVAMIHVKQARLMAQPKRDNFVDIAGYAACGWEAQEATNG